jgi:hypothetical protein
MNLQSAEKVLEEMAKRCGARVALQAIVEDVKPFLPAIDSYLH